MAPNELHREACRRRHRIIGFHLAIFAWTNDLDCVVLDESALKTLLALDRVKGERQSWIKEDIKCWFPFMYAVAAKGSAVWALFLSRKPFTPHGSTIGVRIRSEFITNAIAAGVRIGEFDSLHQSGEADIVSNLALLSVGLREPPAPYPRQTTK